MDINRPEVSRLLKQVQSLFRHIISHLSETPELISSVCPWPDPTDERLSEGGDDFLDPSSGEVSGREGCVT